MFAAPTPHPPSNEDAHHYALEEEPPQRGSSPIWEYELKGECPQMDDGGFGELFVKYAEEEDPVTPSPSKSLPKEDGHQFEQVACACAPTLNSR